MPAGPTSLGIVAEVLAIRWLLRRTVMPAGNSALGILRARYVWPPDDGGGTRASGAAPWAIQQTDGAPGRARTRISPRDSRDDRTRRVAPAP